MPVLDMNGGWQIECIEVHDFAVLSGMLWQHTAEKRTLAVPRSKSLSFEAPVLYLLVLRYFAVLPSKR